MRNPGVGFTALQFNLIVVQPHTLSYQMDTACLAVDSTRICYGYTGHFDPLEPFCRLCFSLLLPTYSTPFIRSHLTWSSPNTVGIQQLIHWLDTGLKNTTPDHPGFYLARPVLMDTPCETTTHSTGDRIGQSDPHLNSLKHDTPLP